MVDVQIVLAVLFVGAMVLFLYRNRQQVVFQKVISYVIYLFLYRSHFGIRWINHVGKKYRNIIVFLGYCFIGIAVVSLIFISYSLIKVTLDVIFKPSAATNAIVPVLPFTNIPGIGFLPFDHWIITIFILALVHEFAHGIVAKAHGLEIKNTGFAFLGIVIPIVPMAFVEPDEKQLQKKPDYVQYSIFAAGPLANILLALVLVILFPYVANPSALAPFEDKLTEPVGFSLTLTNNSMPAARAGMYDGIILDAFNGQPLTTAQPFLDQMYACVKPNQTITLDANGTRYTITTASDETGQRGIIGVTNFKNERKLKEGYPSWIGSVFFWFKGLFRWLYLLNLFVGLANLIPLGIVDGGRMLQTFLHSTIHDKKKAQMIWKWISLVFLGIILFGLLVYIVGNPFS